MPFLMYFSVNADVRHTNKRGFQFKPYAKYFGIISSNDTYT